MTAAEASESAARLRREFRPNQVAVSVTLLGVLLSVAVAWTAWTLNRSNDHRLLEVQTHQAAAVISSAVLSITGPLETALNVAAASNGDLPQFDRAIANSIGAKRIFVSAELWRVTNGVPRLLAKLGVSPDLGPDTTSARAFIDLAFHSRTFVVTGIPKADPDQRVVYALANPAQSPFVVYTERAIPANREEPVESDSAFADLNYATYLGRRQSPASLATTDVPISALPIGGNPVVDSIPFGNSTITLVTNARVALGGSLGSDLPWIFLIGGVALTVAVAWAARQLVRRRRDAEDASMTISGLYRDLDRLYDEQRTIAEVLQSALLPTQHPSIASLEVASRYVAGAEGVEIGGDWFSIIELDDRHFAFAVGDVSGRGVEAAALMARLRFSIEGYLSEGHPPDAVLNLCSRQLDIVREAHFATVLVGSGDLETGIISIANAGHLRPLVISTDGTTHYVDLPLGPPLGVTQNPYEMGRFELEAGSTLLGFTDGLVERRYENIDLGLERLAAAASAQVSSPDDLLTAIVARMSHESSQDDLAILAIHRRIMTLRAVGPSTPV